jgi:hypothetical protein
MDWGQSSRDPHHEDLPLLAVSYQMLHFCWYYDVFMIVWLHLLWELEKDSLIRSGVRNPLRAYFISSYYKLGFIFRMMFSCVINSCVLFSWMTSNPSSTSVLGSNKPIIAFGISRGLCLCVNVVCVLAVSMFRSQCSGQETVEPTDLKDDQCRIHWLNIQRYESTAAKFLFRSQAIIGIRTIV